MVRYADRAGPWMHPDDITDSDLRYARDVVVGVPIPRSRVDLAALMMRGQLTPAEALELVRT